MQAAAKADSEEGRRLAGLELELARLGVSEALLAETMGEKEEEAARRLREARDKQVQRLAVVVVVAAAELLDKKRLADSEEQKPTVGGIR